LFMSTSRGDDSDQFGCGVLGTGSPSQFTHTQDGVPENVNSVGVMGLTGAPADVSTFVGDVLGRNMGVPFSAAVAGFATAVPSPTFDGIVAFGFMGGKDPVFNGSAGVYGESVTNGVFGRTTSSAALDNGVFGQSDGPGHGVAGFSKGTGASGFLAGQDPVFSEHAGVYGQSDQQGVIGLSTSDAGTGVYGGNTGRSATHGIGVRGETFDGVGVQGQRFGSGLAGNFIGDVKVDGSISVTGDVLLANKDIAEQFALTPSAQCEPGMVMVVGADGGLSPCDRAYDKRVVGVVSGAGTLRPAVMLGHGSDSGPVVGIALVGTAFCMADADEARIEIGDLLTSAPACGHAMKAKDALKSTGAVIGKALAGLDRGRGLIPIVISLQ